MALVFIDAVPGTGKTTLVKELQRRGEEAHDTDDECIMLSKQTGKVVEYENRKKDPYDWVYPTENLQELKKLSQSRNVFLSGSVDNWDEVRAAADKYVWMEIPLEVLLARLDERHDDYGKSDSERQSIMNLHKEMEAMGHPNAFKLDATKSVEQIVDDLLAYSESSK